MLNVHTVTDYVLTVTTCLLLIQFLFYYFYIKHPSRHMKYNVIVLHDLQ